MGISQECNSWPNEVKVNRANENVVRSRCLSPQEFAFRIDKHILPKLRDWVNGYVLRIHHEIAERTLDPFYRGPAVPHPEDVMYMDIDDPELENV